MVTENLLLVVIDSNSNLRAVVNVACVVAGGSGDDCVATWERAVEI